MLNEAVTVTANGPLPGLHQDITLAESVAFLWYLRHVSALVGSFVHGLTERAPRWSAPSTAPEGQFIHTSTWRRIWECKDEIGPHLTHVEWVKVIRVLNSSSRVTAQGLLSWADWHISWVAFTPSRNSEDGATWRPGVRGSVMLLGRLVVGPNALSCCARTRWRRLDILWLCWRCRFEPQSECTGLLDGVPASCSARQSSRRAGTSGHEGWLSEPFWQAACHHVTSLDVVQAATKVWWDS